MMNRSTVLDILVRDGKADGCLEIDWDDPLNYAKFVNELIFYSVVALARRVGIPDDVLASKLERSGCRCCTFKNSHIVIHDVHLKLKLMAGPDTEIFERGGCWLHP